jgi:hypothetical protein
MKREMSGKWLALIAAHNSSKAIPAHKGKHLCPVSKPEFVRGEHNYAKNKQLLTI